MKKLTILAVGLSLALGTFAFAQDASTTDKKEDKMEKKAKKKKAKKTAADKAEDKKM